MRLRKRQSGGAMQLNMTPMIDVTFLLLIFFMTVNQASAVSKIKLDLAKQEGSLDQEESKIIINVTERGTFFIGAEACTLNVVLDRVQSAIAKYDNDPDRVSITVRIDRKVKCQHTNELFSALGKLKISHVAWAVQQVKS